MSIKVTYAQFLTTNGVPLKRADTVAAGVEAKIRKREPLTPDEIALTAAFLNRPGANAVAERHVGLAILTSNMRASGPNATGGLTTGKRRHHPAGAGDPNVTVNGGPLGFVSPLMGTGTPAAGQRVPTHTPEWTNPNDPDPGARVVPSQAKVIVLAPAASVGGKQTASAGASTKKPGPPAPFAPTPLPNIAAAAIRDLAGRIAAGFQSSAGGSPNV